MTWENGYREEYTENGKLPIPKNRALTQVNCVDHRRRHERPEVLGNNIHRHFDPGMLAPHSHGNGHGGVDVTPADPAWHEHPQGHGYSPAPVDREEVTVGIFGQDLLRYGGVAEDLWEEEGRRWNGRARQKGTDDMDKIIDTLKDKLVDSDNKDK